MKYLSINELKRRLRFLDSTDLRKITYSQYFEYLRETFEGYSQSLMSMDLDKENSEDSSYGIFRARPVLRDELFLKSEDLWARPAKEVDQFGRCHNIGESKLYCSNHFATTLIECRAKENTYWVITEYELTEREFYMLPVGLRSNRFDNPQKIPCLSETLNISELKRNLLIERYIRDSFKQVVIPKETIQYMKSFAITDYLLKNDQAKNNLFGIIYPSVPSRLQGMNFCFTSEVASKVLKIKKARYIKLKNFDYLNGKVNFAIMADGFANNDGITWSATDRWY